MMEKREPIFDVELGRNLALVVIDMQNYFLDPKYPASVPDARGIVASINTMADAMRRASGMVVWIKTVTDFDSVDPWIFEDQLLSEQARNRRRECLTDGHHAAEFWPEVEISKGDLVVSKTRYSAMIQGSSRLPELLKENGIRTILIAGTVTNVCCESTARDAMMLNYQVVMLEDALAARKAGEHHAALDGFRGRFGDVRSVSELIA